MANTIFLSPQTVGSQAVLFTNNATFVANTISTTFGGVNTSTGTVNTGTTGVTFTPGTDGDVATVSLAVGSGGNTTLFLLDQESSGIVGELHFNSPVVVDEHLSLDDPEYIFQEINTSLIDASGMTTNLPVGYGDRAAGDLNIDAVMYANTAIAAKVPNYYRARLHPSSPSIAHGNNDSIAGTRLWFQKVEGVDFINDLVDPSGGIIGWQNTTGRTITLDITGTASLPDPGGPGTRRVSLIKNGNLVTGQMAQEGFAWGPYTNTIMNYSAILQLAPDDTFEVRVWQSNAYDASVTPHNAQTFSSSGTTYYLPGDVCNQIAFIELW